MSATAWFLDGEAHVLAVVDGLDDADLAVPSRLPGWTRAHVVGHLARNADALGNLLHWARTGEPTPMYGSVEERADGIDASALQEPGALRADLHEASARLVDRVADLPEAAWDTEIRTAQGRVVPASVVPWMRVRETWVHAVDLDAGASFGDAPPDLVAALLDEIATWPSAAAADPPLAVTAEDLDRTWVLGEGAAPVDVAGPAAAVLTWLSGRADGHGLRTSDPSGDPPAPPAWL